VTELMDVTLSREGRAAWLPPSTSRQQAEDVMTLQTCILVHHFPGNRSGAVIGVAEEGIPEHSFTALAADSLLPHTMLAAVPQDQVPQLLPFFP
jgi:hypothetical protein